MGWVDLHDEHLCALLENQGLIPGGSMDFSLHHHVHSGSGVNLTYQMGSWDYFSECKVVTA
jgi:hypothetical protein